VKLAQRHAALNALGWRTNTPARYRQSVRDFQRATGLTITGLCGPITQRRLAKALERKRQGLPDISEYYSAAEFACKCGGFYEDCRRIWIKRSTLVKINKTRRRYGKPLPIVSGCRCLPYNLRIGSMPGSRHVQGDAVDLPQLIFADRMIGYRLWTGIGTGSVSNSARHVDNRPSASVWNPIRWYYTGW
jgi:hypothetical protein